MLPFSIISDPPDSLRCIHYTTVSDFSASPDYYMIVLVGKLIPNASDRF